MIRLLALCAILAGCASQPADINLDGYVDVDFDSWCSMEDCDDEY